MFCICPTRSTLEPSVPCSVPRSQTLSGYVYKARLLCSLALGWKWPKAALQKQRGQEKGEVMALTICHPPQLAIPLPTKLSPSDTTVAPSLAWQVPQEYACLCPDRPRSSPTVLSNFVLNFVKISLVNSLQFPCLNVLHIFLDPRWHLKHYICFSKIFNVYYLDTWLGIYPMWMTYIGNKFIFSWIIKTKFFVGEENA